MTETAESIAALDLLIQASVASSGQYLRESFELPEHVLDAAQLVGLFERSRTVALATVTKSSEPRVAPVESFLHAACFWMPTVQGAARCRHVARNPAASVTCFERDWAVLAHGSATIVRPSDAAFAEAEERAREAGLSSVLEWGQGVYLRMEPRALITWRRHLTGP